MSGYVMRGTTARSPESGEGTVAEDHRNDYAELVRQVRDAGFLNPRPVFYAATIAVNLTLFAAAWGMFAWLGDSWWQIATAIFLAVMFTQIAFVGHDAGHRQIFRGRRGNKAVGLLFGNLLVGVSYGWWVRKHNRHHSYPNTIDRDPDIGGTVFVFTADRAHRRRGAALVLTRCQAVLFFPVLLLEGVHLRTASVRWLAARRDFSAAVEALLLTVHATCYLTAVLLVLSPVKTLAFVVVQQALFGFYMGSTFAPNHKGMRVFAAQEVTDFASRQVLSSRNIRGGRLTDLVFGGLNYQIEHHLFPGMPRPNLRHSQGLVREFCRQHGLPYHQSSLLSSYTEALRHLHTVGHRQPTEDASPPPDTPGSAGPGDSGTPTVDALTKPAATGAVG